MLQPKSMQQIAILIITFLAYVKGIRNGGSNSMQHNYESSPAPYSHPYMDPNSFFPSQPLTHMPETLGNAGRQSNGFRPSQILDFTTSDAAELHNFPPTYVDANYPTQSIATRYVLEKQFSFPNEQQLQQQLQAAPSNAHNYNFQPQTNTNTPSAVPNQLQSTPILTYRDPYTNENYHHTPTPSSEANTHRRPQDFYTVQSSLMVGQSGGANKFGSRPANDYQRPGYVFDEQVSPSYERPVYTQGNSKYSQYQSTPQHPNAITPNYNRELPGQTHRPPTPPATSRPRPGEHLSYDSHDYPPPSYFQQQQQSTNFQSPQRQDTANYASTSPNYANNFGNYLQGEEYMGNYQPPPPPPNYSSNGPQYGHIQRPPSRPPPAGHNNYNEYQQGEVPPPPPPPKPSSNYPPSYRPPYRPTSSQQQPSGLASLASLFTSTQQYAPQFTNLLLGGGGGGGSPSASNPLGSILGALTGGGSNSAGYGGGGGGGYGSRPPPANNMQLIKALENIARNDDLQCVPKVLCQMIAGQTQRGQLPSFITSPAITNFLAGFPAASPALIYGRAALLGISGGESSCTQTYTQCPKNEFEILHYLNNHRGGFFKFFSEPEEQTATHQSSGGGGGGAGATSLFSILSALTGGGNPVSVPTTTTPRPRPRPTQAASSSDITSGIGNFFTNVLSEYLGGVEYQRRRRRRSLDNYEEEIEADIEQETETQKSLDSEDFHDEEDDEDTQSGMEFVDSSEQFDDVEERILHKEVHALNEAKFFPAEEEGAKQHSLENAIKNFNKANAGRKLKFPSDTEVRVYADARELENTQSKDEGEEDSRRGKRIHFKDDDEEYSKAQRDYEAPVNFIENENENDSTLRDSRRGKMIIFKDANEDQSSQHSEMDQAIVVAEEVDNEEPQRGGRVIFPDHYNSLIRTGRILNRPAYAATYVDYVRTNQDDQDKFVVSNAHRKPYYQGSTGSSVDSNNNNNNYNAAYYSQSSSAAQNSFSSQSSGNYVSSNYNGGSSNHNRYYTPSSATNSNSNYNNNYNYPNNNYVSNNRYSSNYQPARTTSRPQQDDKNVYVTNSHGITEYYLTPDGRKVYL